LCAIRVVFESNLVEGAGLSRGETQRVVNDYFPQIPDAYEAFREFRAATQHLLFMSNRKEASVLLERVEKHGVDIAKIQLSYSPTGKPRAFMEVLQHQLALVNAQMYALTFNVSMLRYVFAQVIVAKKSARQRRKFIESYGGRTPENVREPKFINGRMIRTIHKIMSQGLMPPDVQTPPGVYRTEDVMVGFDVSFPSWKLVPKSMAEFVKQSNRLMSKAFFDTFNPFVAAARISYDFVRVHPFPDFNGRVSRLLLMAVLMVNKVPFPVSIRADKRGRERYFYALKAANRGNIMPYATLIAKSVAEAFEEIDENLRRAGLRTILSHSEG
jgi:Fic family protein